MTDALRQTIAANRAGETVALPSVCSAHRDVLRAAMLLTEGQGQPLLIEATSNQVNQDGGYTGMKPADFVAYIHAIADETGFPKDQIILGGDHLGPQAWKDQPAEKAMEKAKVLVASYVAAGFTKIHLDCSEGCLGEPAHLDDSTVASRAAVLAEICETAATDPTKLSYIVGTEVPVPGGARTDHEGVVATRPAAAAITMQAHLAAFSTQASSRIVGLVVQPGVEFGAIEIDHLPLTDTAGLDTILADFDDLTFEAHSTDYQEHAAYARLADMGFAIHKVGPALTFAYRQAIYGLDHLRSEMFNQPITVAAVMEAEMLAHPNYWQGHYAGGDAELRLLRHYSYSDRIRYYWPREAPQNAVHQLIYDLADLVVPTPLLLQYFSIDVIVRADALSQSLPQPDRLILATIQAALAPYHLGVKGAA